MATDMDQDTQSGCRIHLGVHGVDKWESDGQVGEHEASGLGKSPLLLAPLLVQFCIPTTIRSTYFQTFSLETHPSHEVG